eukprot:3832595-Pyramimonas_sp.AAC.1
MRYYPAHIIVSHKYRFIYIKHAKSAGSTIWRGILEPQLCGAYKEGSSYHSRYKVCARLRLPSSDQLRPQVKNICVKESFRDFAMTGSYYVTHHFHEYPTGLLAHLRPQTIGTFDNDDAGIHAMDFVGRVQYLSEDLTTVFDVLNKRRASGTAAALVVPSDIPMDNANLLRPSVLKNDTFPYTNKSLWFGTEFNSCFNTY